MDVSAADMEADSVSAGARRRVVVVKRRVAAREGLGDSLIGVASERLRVAVAAGRRVLRAERRRAYLQDWQIIIAAVCMLGSVRSVLFANGT